MQFLRREGSELMAPLDGRKVIAVFAPSYPPAFLGGGPARSVEALVGAAGAQYDIAVLAPDHDLGVREPLAVVSNRWISRDDVKVMYVSPSIRHILLGLIAARRRAPSILYFNSFFNPVFSILPQVLWRFGFWGRPVRLMAPRGEMGRGALGRRNLKKPLYMGLFRLLRLHRELVWHASSRDEAEDIRRHWGDDADIVIRENETKLPEIASIPRPAPRGSPVRLVYLARIVEHKGLAIALEALSSCTVQVIFDILGSVEDPGYAARCRAAAAALPANVNATFWGPADPESIRGILENRDILLMPTSGENFAHAIAEALSASCVVIASQTTPWTKTLTAGGGYAVTERTVEAWERALSAFVNLDAESLLQARLGAMRAYNSWRSKPQEMHVFDQVSLKRAQDVSGE
ncbi:glycosyltransferase [Cryobacterium sp. TMT2-23]|uniref:glycosyltransferase n=1 Tax=Cryobacterium sp. TMT2-23 TaxID=1259252 RepID=UPI00106BD34E|nr:glycosyltransferase [Cryobacterium sp. TMT2-23]TFD22394.1 glycosyltransferase [Cryobacterium sp. TMT2-23]